jgi:hypothetical protein
MHGLENWECGLGDPLRWPRDTLYPQMLALSSLISGGRSVVIVSSRTKATEFSFSFFSMHYKMLQDLFTNSICGTIFTKAGLLVSDWMFSSLALQWNIETAWGVQTISFLF